MESAKLTTDGTQVLEVPIINSIKVNKEVLSRVLYTNPVCLLTVWNPNTKSPNVMTITWLTPINNKGTFVCSMNKKRFTAHLITECKSLNFVLSVPVKGQEELVVAIGRCSGAKENKIKILAIKLCKPGWIPLTQGDIGSTQLDDNSIPTTALNDTPPKSTRKKPIKKLAEENVNRVPLFAVENCCCHITCTVLSVEEADEDHHLLKCQINEAYVKSEYWVDGKKFVANSEAVPPYLTFLGTQEFGVNSILDCLLISPVR